MGPCEMKTKMYHAMIPNKQGSKSLRSYGEKFTWSNGAREVEKSKKGAQPRSNQTKLELTCRREKKSAQQEICIRKCEYT